MIPYRIAHYSAAIMLLVFLSAGQALATGDCDVPVGRLATVEGRIEVQSTGASGWQPGTLNAELCQGDTVRAGERSRATVALINQAVLRIDQNSAMRLDNITGVTGERSALSLLKGAFQSFSRKPRGFEVSTPYLNGSIEGTEFVFRVEEDTSVLTVFEGTVLASNAHGSATVSSGESVAAMAGQAPQPRTVVRPRDAAQWSLYYPPILAAGDSGVSPALQQAASDLSVGRVNAARASVDQAIADNTDAGLAYALRAVINVVQNRQAQALADGNQAVSLSPDSAAARIALSYAQQANFQIPEARDTLQQAVAQQPDNALARARLAELQLMLGEREQATASAQQAVTLAPDLGRTQITLGFAALAEFRNRAAGAAFERAIELDSADPLPHLGLGLSRISAGDLEAGRKDIEVAVGLGSNDALLRSYLGKAYFEEKRAPLDSDQFAIAKQLDPNDPTAYLYSGIARQTQNRPVEAVEDLERSVELNDNRAAFRGRLLLDKDRAARGTSLARAYNDLGFEQAGINESTESLTADPANASAHRFLSDTYRDTRRREISRVSELFQAQMMQDININPIQPSVSSTNLNIVTAGGPAGAGFNEFTPLFERNKTQFNMTGFGGDNDTSGGEAVVTSLYDNYSLSAGAFTYDTDGFRGNNDLRHRIHNFYGQAAITPALNMQAEFRHRDTENGDLALNFDPDQYDNDFEKDFKENTARIGLRFTPDASSTVLLSYIYSDREDDQTDSDVLVDEVLPPAFPGAPPGFLNVALASDNETDEESHQYEAQYLHKGAGFNLTAGTAFANVDQEFTYDSVTTEIFQAPVPGAPPVTTVTPELLVDKPEIDDARAYVYANLEAFEAVNVTLGFSYQDYDEDAFDVQRFNPKLGATWDIVDSLRLRGAYYETVKPALASNRTLEPTQIAGFNQFFDDANGTKSKGYGGALDWRATRDVFAGMEFTRRDFESPAFFYDDNRAVFDADFEDRDEWLHKAYAYWTPADRWSLSAEALYDKYESELSRNPDRPREVRTISYPLRVQYFHPVGVFGGVGVTYVDQEVDRDVASSLADGDSDFTVTDLAVGYRLPRRQGIVSLAVQNLFDEDFDYQDDSFRTFQDEPSVGPYIPERSFMARVTLNF